MDITDQILQKIKTSPEIGDYALVRKNNMLVIRGSGYDVKVEVIDDKSVVISKTWKLGIVGALFYRQKEHRMKKIIESIYMILEKDHIKIHSVMMV